MKNKHFNSFGLLLSIISLSISSCSNATEIPSSTSNSSILVSSDGTFISSIPQSSVSKVYVESRVLSKPNNTEIIDLKATYLTGDWMDFSINNSTGHELIVTINNEVIEPNENNRYRYQVKNNDYSLIINVKEDITIISPVVKFTPEVYSSYVNVQFLNEIKHNETALIQFSKTPGYEITNIKINNYLTNYVTRLESDRLSLPIDNDLTELIIEITVTKSENANIRLEIDSQSQDTYSIIGKKDYYKINEQVQFTITPNDYYKIDSVTLNGEILNSTSPTSSDSKLYSFIVKPVEIMTLVIKTSPKMPIVKGNIIMYKNNVPTAINKVPGMYVLITNERTNQKFTSLVDFSKGSSFITAIDNNNGQYSQDSYSIQLYIPNGLSSTSVTVEQPGLHFSTNDYSFLITIPDNTDLTYFGEYPLTSPIRITKSNKVIDDGNNVMISSERKNVKVSFDIKYTGKIVNGDSVIHNFGSNTQTQRDFSFTFSLKDGYYYRNDYLLTFYHNRANGNYYLTHKLQQDEGTVDVLINDTFIKALQTGDLSLEFTRTYENNKYVYNLYYYVKGQQRDDNNKLFSITRDTTVTFIGSELEYEDSFPGLENKGDFEISSYKIYCQDV